MIYIGDELHTPEDPPRLRRLQEIAVMVLHRFGGWAGGLYIYPETKEEAKRKWLPWRPELVGQGYGDDPWEVARFFGQVFGWRHPYTLQEHAGIMYQTAPLNVITPHAGDFNREALGVLVTGDHRDTPPAEVSLEVTASTLAEICRVKKWHPSAQVKLGGESVPRILGHDEGPTGITKTPGKRCPGNALEMDVFRDRVAGHLDRKRWESLSAAGFVLSS